MSLFQCIKKHNADDYDWERLSKDADEKLNLAKEWSKKLNLSENDSLLPSLLLEKLALSEQWDEQITEKVN